MAQRTLLATIDIGNSAATYGIHRGSVILRSGFTKSCNIPKLAKSEALGRVLTHSNKVIVSSVVPYLTNRLVKMAIAKMGQESVYVVGRNVHPRVPMRYKRRALGSDRLVNIYGALRVFEPPPLRVCFWAATPFA